MNRYYIRALFVASTLAAAVPASAEPPILVEGVPQVLVPYGDLDLSRPAGQASLQGRVRRAANQLCATDMRGIGPVTQERSCRSAALAQAQGQIDRAIALAGTPQFAQRGGITMARR